MKSIRSYIMVSFLSLLSVSILLILFISISSTYSMTENLVSLLYESQLDSSGNQFVNYMYEQFGQLSLNETGELLDENGESIAERYSYLDKFSNDSNMVATVFGKTGTDYTRIITSIIGDDGNRVIGTILDPTGKVYISMNNGQDFLGEANILGKDYVTKYMPIFDANNQVIGIYFVGIPIVEVETTLSENFSKLFFSLAISAVIILIITVFISYYISRSISRPIKCLTNNIIRQSQLDFTHGDQTNICNFENRKDELGKITRALIKLETSIKGFITISSQISNDVEQASYVLQDNAMASSKSASEISDTVGEIAEGATDQADQTTIGTEQLGQLGRLIDKDRSQINEVTNAAKHTSKLVKQGLDIIEALKEKTTLNSNATERVQQTILKTDQSAMKINEASNLIASISNQTNLLALNAAIEAARAGEHGRGFAIVAEEIRKLAEQTMDSTKNIDAMIAELKSDANTAVENINEAAVIVDEQESQVKMTYEKFEEISLSMEQATSAIDEINLISQELEAMKDQVQDVLQSLSALAEENAAATQEVSATVELQSTGIERIAESTVDLGDLINKLNTELRKFKI